MFRPFSSSATGGWMNPAAGGAFRALADSYGAMSADIERKAQESAHDTLVRPALDAGAHPSTQAFYAGDSLYVGVPPEHPDTDELADQEWGTLTRPAGGHIRRSLRANAGTSFEHFQKRLAE